MRDKICNCVQIPVLYIIQINGKKEDDILQKVLELMNKPEDDAQTFGNFVAASIRNLKTDERKNIFKHKIQRVILKIEELDDAEQSSLASIPITNPSWESSSCVYKESEISFTDL